jgi:class 3 adenylate cyclase
VNTLPQTRYAPSSGDVRIAYQVFGSGPVEVLFITGFVFHVEAVWEEPPFRRFFERLGSFARVAMFDKRGQGLSDRLGEPPTLEQTMDDAIAVMDAAGMEHPALLGVSEGGPATILTAATHPDRVGALILYGTYARVAQSESYPDGIPASLIEDFATLIDMRWGDPIAPALFAPSLLDDREFLDSWARFLRRGTSPRGAKELMRLYLQIDVRDVLPAISAPTLVIHRKGDRLTPLAGAKYLAERIPGARLVELPGDDHIFTYAPDQILDEVEEFLTGERRGPEPDRVLATVMFTDIVGSTERAAALGDQRWRELVTRHDDVVLRELQRHRGKPIKTLGDGFLATFDGPARGIRCARAIADEVQAVLDMEVRAGLHTGECELVGQDVSGMAVNIGARVAALAGPGEVLVSSTVKDLVFGSGIQFAERGEHSLKGVPGAWRLFAAMRD